MPQNALRWLSRTLPALGLSLVAAAVAIAKGAPKEVIKDPTDKAAQNTPLQFTVKDIDGKEVNLADYKGKVVLIVNVASKCGFTPQYKGLEALYEKYKGRGFVILGFPANNFGGQEPGSEEQIKQFCSSKYNVSFPMMSKVSVKGDDITPLYKHLTEEQSNGEFAGDIEWNFNKFLVDRNGSVIARFPSPTKPEDAKVTSAIEKALAAKPAK